MKIINLKFTFLTLFFCFAIFSNANAKVVEVEANGVGSDYDWAVLNALENAVKQSSKISIEKVKPIETVDVTVTENGNVKEAIYSQMNSVHAEYKGKVSSYKVLSQEEKNGKTYVHVLAQIEKADDANDYVSSDVSPEIVENSKYNLVIMPFKGMKNYTCANKNLSLSTINESLNNSLTTKFSESGDFSVLDRQNLDAYSNEVKLIESGNTQKSDKAKLRNINSGDYMIVGSISEFQSNSSTRKIDISGEQYAKSYMKIRVDYRIIEIDTTQVIYSGTAEAAVNDEEKMISCTATLNELSDELAFLIVRDSTATLFPNHQKVVVSKISSTDDVVDIEPLTSSENSETTSGTNQTTHKTTTTTVTKTREVVKLPYD